MFALLTLLVGEAGMGMHLRPSSFYSLLAYGTAILLPLALLSGPRFGLTVLASTLLLSFCIWQIPWNSRSRFLQHFYRIERGMTEKEVREIMVGYMEGTGWPASVEDAKKGTGRELRISGSVVFRHSNEGAYDSDWGIVKFRDGSVLGTRFSPD